LIERPMTRGVTFEQQGRCRGACTRSGAARAATLIAVLALGLTLSACDKCGDFIWQKEPGACKGGPPPR